MSDLGRLEDLPPSYVAELRQLNLVPLWPSLRGVLPPGEPRVNTQPTCWAYADIRPLLLRAGELTPIERAERRVLVLANPGARARQDAGQCGHVPGDAVAAAR